MTLDELATLARQVRDAQKAYFKTRTTSALEKSKRLERDLDHALWSLKSPPAPTLFDEPAEAPEPAKPLDDELRDLAAYMRAVDGETAAAVVGRARAANAVMLAALAEIAEAMPGADLVKNNYDRQAIARAALAKVKAQL